MSVGSVSHTRLIFPAITAISILLALGWHAFLPRRFELGFSSLLTAGLLALNIYSLGWLIYPAFTPNDNPLPATSSALNLTVLDRLQLVAGDVYPGLEFESVPKPQKVAKQGDIVTIQAQWQSLAQVDKNYSVAALLLAPDGSVLAQRHTYPGLGLRPTRYLNPGAAFTDIYPLNLETNVSEPMVARAVVNLFDVDSETRAGFPALDAQGNEVTPVVGQIKIVPDPWPQYHPQNSAQVNFAHAIKLIGYDLPEPQNLTLYWQSLTVVDEDYNLFIHLVDAEGNIIAQADAPPTGNVYPTNWWSPGETIADRHTLPIAPDITRIRIGLYSLITGNRLPVINSDLPTEDNGVDIELK